MRPETGHILWEYQAGEHTVVETEHMFGCDVIMFRVVDGRPYPTAIVGRAEPMLDYQRRHAIRWANCLSSGDYLGAVHAMQALCEVPLP